MSEEGRQLAVDLVGQPFDASRQAPRRDEHANLRDRRHERGRGDHTEKELSPDGHTFSRVRAC